MSFNHELGIKVSLHQAFAGELDTCKDALQDLSDMQEYRRLKDNIEEYIDKKSGEGVIPHNPLEFYLEQLINAEKFLKNLTSETERLHSLQKEQVKDFEKLDSKGASLKKDRATFQKIEATLDEVSSELERISSIQEKYRNEISHIVWKETDGQFRLYRELATLSIIKKKHLFDFEASGDVAALIKELRATYPELGLAEAKEIAETGDYSSIVPLIIGVEAGEADDLFDFVFGRGALHDSICEQLHARKESVERLISDHNGQKESISNSLAETENRNYLKADAILKQLRRIFSDFDYEGLESQIAKVRGSVALINGKFESFRSELESLVERDNNSPEQASRDKARCLHIAHEWDSWVDSKYKNLFSDHPNSEAYKESTHSLEHFQNQFRLLIDKVIPSIEVRLLKSEQHSLYKDIEALLVTVTNWPGQVKKTKEEYKSRATKWTALKVQLKNSFADHNKSEFSESAQQSLSNVLAECDAKISNGVEQLNARLTRTRLKLWGGLTCFLMILCAGGFFGHKHLRSLNILDVKVATAGGTPIKNAIITVNGVVFSSGAIVPTGDLEITVEAKGYDEQTLPTKLKIGKPLSLGTIKLKRSLGEVLVTSTHDIHWTASFVGKAEVKARVAKGEFKESSLETKKLETGNWDLSASITNKFTKKVWTRTNRVEVLKDRVIDTEIIFNVGKFTVTSEPKGVEIFFDDILIGTNRVSVPNVKPGEYSLVFKVKDFLTEEIKTKNQPLSIRSDEETRINESFKVASTFMNSSPPGAQVIYEDKMLGETPLTISTFSEGEYRFLLRYPDKFEEAIGKKGRWIEKDPSIDMKVGESKKYKEDFGLVDLNLDSDPKGARIKIFDSEKDALSSLKGLTPLILSPIKPGQYQIVMEIEDLLGSLGNKEKRWWSITNNVTVASGKNAEVNSAFVGGKVEIKSVPSGADVMIGNRMLGKTPFEMEGLMPEKTDLTLRIKDEFGIKTKTGQWYLKTKPLEVIAGKTAKLDEEFKYGSIKLDSVPKGAEVMCKGVPLGKAPLIENLVPRNYQFDFKYGMMPPQKDYIISKSFEIKPSVKSAETVEFQFATINLATDPDGLAMEWNGHKTKSPFSFNQIKPGEHQFKILSGISSTNYVFSVEGGDVVQQEIILNSSIDLTTQPAGAKIVHKDDQIGVSPKKLPNLFPGFYGFVISMKGYRDVDCRITTLSNKVTRCELPLVPATPNPFRDRQLRTAYAGYLETPEQSEKYIADSVTWIISKRNKRGYWNTKSGFLSDPRNTAVTALALIGLLNHGHTYGGPEANDVVLTKGVNHILDNAKRTGCLDTDNKMLGHGLATLLIASLDQDKIQGKVKIALQNALTYSANQQNGDGSWGKEPGVQYESIFILLSYLAAEDAGIEMQAMKKSKTQLEILVKNNLKIFNKGLANLLVLASKKQGDNPNAGDIEKLVNRCLKSISDVGEDGMLADCFILSQISGKLRHKQKTAILRDLTKRFSSLRTDIKPVEKSGYWKTSGKWCPSSDDHMFYSNIVPLIVFQSFYQGGDVSEPVVLEFNN